MLLGDSIFKVFTISISKILILLSDKVNYIQFNLTSQCKYFHCYSKILLKKNDSENYYNDEINK